MIERDETLGDARLILGNALNVLPALSADHIIGDPPYEDELHNATRRGLRQDSGAELRPPGFAGVNADRAAIAAACVEASQGWVILFSLAEGVRAWRDDLQAAGARWDTTCAWVKPDAAPRFNGQGPARGFEAFVTCWAGTGYRRWNGGGKRGVYTHTVNPPGRDGHHPTEKPLALMREIIRDFTQPGEVVCDPFMGSGATGVAALMEGRRFIGIDADPAWFGVARDRISAAAGLFDGAAEPSLFASLPKARRPARVGAS